MWTIQTSNQGSGGWVACPPEGTHGYYVIFHYGSDEVLKAAAQEYADFKNAQGKFSLDHLPEGSH